MRPNNPVLSADFQWDGQTPIPSERPFIIEAEVKVLKQLSSSWKALKSHAKEIPYRKLELVSQSQNRSYA